MATPGQTNQNVHSPVQGNAKKSVSDDIDVLRSDIASLAGSVGKLASEAVGTTAADAKVMAGEKLGDLESAIRRNPTQSAMVAVGIGFLFGLIVTR